VPADLHGRAHLDLALAQFEHGIITELQGALKRAIWKIAPVGRRRWAVTW